MPLHRLLPSPSETVRVVLPTESHGPLNQVLAPKLNGRKKTNSPQGLGTCLAKSLSLPTAIWCLAVLQLPSMPGSGDCEQITIQAKVMFVDMVLDGIIAFKLTETTIESLTEYHKRIVYGHLDAVGQKLHGDFLQSIQNFVFITKALPVLEKLNPDGSGKLDIKDSKAAEAWIMMLIPRIPPNAETQIWGTPPFLCWLEYLPTGSWAQVGAYAKT